MRKSQDLMCCTQPEEIIWQMSKRNYYCVRKNNRAKAEFINLTCALDIETTSTETDGFLYTIQANFGGMNVLVRYVEDWLRIVDMLVENFELTPERKLVIYVHNLGYEHMYLTQIMRERYGLADILLTKSRKPLYIRYNNGIELRDSLKLFQKSLAGATKGLPHAKLVGNLDYKIYRTPDTPLSPDEWNYCINDVQGLYEAIERLKWEHGFNSATIPLTNTAMVIEEINKYCRKDGKCMQAMKDLKLDKRQTRLAYKCMAGGDTHGTRWRAGRVYHDCNSYDLKSAHSSQQLLKKFPSGKPITLPGGTTLAELDALTESGYGWIAQIFIYDFAIRPECPNPTISVSKCEQIKESRGTDNGRLLGALGALVYMDSNDFQRFREGYDFDESEVVAVEAVAFYLKYLPDGYREAILDKFKIKESASDGLERRFAKICVNTVYGASAQKTVRDEYSLPDEDGLLDANHLSWECNLEQLEEKNVAKKQTNKFPFLWGLWTASLTRLDLWRLQKKVGWENLIYWDTDSVKFEGEKVLEVDTVYNATVRDLCRERGAVVQNKKGKTVYIGSAEDEHPAVDYGYSEFIFLHAKCYAAKAWDGTAYQIETTIAGVGKKEGILAMRGDISNLKDGLYIKHAGGFKLIYHDEIIKTRYDFKRPTKAASWVYMSDRDYLVNWQPEQELDCEIISS